jgi:hypothetical protein
MRRAALGIFLALVIAGCGEAEQHDERVFAEPEQPLSGIYIARYEAPPVVPGTPPRPSRLALFHGSYAVRHGCLVFDLGPTPALPRFPTETEITIFADRVIIAGTTHRFGKRITWGGGSDGDGAYDILVEAPPEGCRLPVIGP